MAVLLRHVIFVVSQFSGIALSIVGALLCVVTGATSPSASSFASSTTSMELGSALLMTHCSAFSLGLILQVRSLKFL